MTNPTLAIILSLVTAFAAFQTWLNHELRRVNDEVAGVCFKPTVVPRLQQVFYFPPDFGGL